MGLKYNGDFDTIKTIKELKRQVCINALCFTPSIKKAAEEVGITERGMHDFLIENNLNHFLIKKMRKEFKNSKIKVKLRKNATEN